MELRVEYSSVEAANRNGQVTSELFAGAASLSSRHDVAPRSTSINNSASSSTTSSIAKLHSPLRGGGGSHITGANNERLAPAIQHRYRTDTKERADAAAVHRGAQLTQIYREGEDRVRVRANFYPWYVHRRPTLVSRKYLFVVPSVPRPESPDRPRPSNLPSLSFTTRDSSAPSPRLSASRAVLFTQVWRRYLSLNCQLWNIVVGPPAATVQRESEAERAGSID